MAELIYDANQLADGQAFILLQVGRGGASNQIVADITMDLTAPATAEHLAPAIMSGFEFPAREALTLAQRRASEMDVRAILIVDPYGLLPHAKINRYERR
jgi:hypothetical protein